MLEKISFVKDFRCLKKDLVIEFKKINPIVGDNGCGKSSLIKAIVEHTKNKDKSYIKVIMKDKMNFIFFDFEKMNTRTSNLDKYANDGNLYEFALLSHFKSHGEINKSILKHIEEVKNTLIILDEPDMALSVRSIKTLGNAIKNSCENNNQFILSCHNPLLIEMLEEVYSLEHKQWMNSTDFIKTQLIN